MNIEFLGSIETAILSDNQWWILKWEISECLQTPIGHLSQFGGRLPWLIESADWRKLSKRKILDLPTRWGRTAQNYSFGNNFSGLLFAAGTANISKPLIWFLQAIPAFQRRLTLPRTLELSFKHFSRADLLIHIHLGDELGIYPSFFQFFIKKRVDICLIILFFSRHLIPEYNQTLLWFLR